MNVTPVNELVKNYHIPPQDTLLQGARPPHQMPQMAPWDPDPLPLTQLTRGVQDPMFPSQASMSRGNVEGFMGSMHSPNCMDVGYHVDECPMCKQMYDKTAHNFTIIIMAVILLILAKKIYQP